MDYERILTELQSLEEKDRFIKWLVIYLKNTFVDSTYSVAVLRKEYAEKALENAFSYAKTGILPSISAVKKEK